MGTREKQNILTIIIIIAILAIALIIGLVVYPDIVEENQTSNNQTESTSKVEEKTSSTTETTSATTETTDNTEENSTYVGEEEKESQEEDVSKTNEEKAIELAKQQWGEDDETVTYSIEQKDGNIYYVAVRIDTEVQQWYEVDTENWTIVEY